MKKIFALSIAILMVISTFAQEPSTDKQKDFDKKFRFGLRATPQLSWLSGNNDLATRGGIVPAFGFGLMLDFRLSDIIHFSTGIGGDFDGGYIKYKYVPQTSPDAFSVNMVLDKENNLVEAKDGVKLDDYALTSGNTQVSLNDRRYRSTFISIPLLLKMMTQEYSGLRYVFLFGGELGIRTGLKANDTYHQAFKASGTAGSTTLTALSGDDLAIKSINVGKEGTLLPFRFGMNLGFGTEYRIAGSTSLYTTINYFHSFTNLVKGKSKYLVKGADTEIASDGSVKFSHLNQGHFARAIRLTVGIMF